MREEVIERLCRASGFPLADLRQEDGVLLLVPSGLDSLPKHEELESLGHRLERAGHDHVAFELVEDE